MPTGIAQGNSYYVISVDANTFKIATSYANALASSAVNFSGYGSGSMSITTPSSSLGGQVIFGNSDGSFSNSSFVSMPGSKSNLVLEDVNGDGHLDIIAGNTVDQTIDVRFGTGTGVFDSVYRFATTGIPNDVKAGDFNGDGIVDITYTNRFGGGNDSVGVALGTGNGNFQTPVNYNSTSDPYKLEVTDVNGDGIEDISIINYLGSSERISFILGNGDGTFRGPVSMLTGVSNQYFTAADFNGDDIVDYASLDGSSTSILILNFQNVTQVTTKKSFSLSSQEVAKASLDYHNELADALSMQKASIGSTQSRLSFALQHTRAMQNEYQDAASRITDADIATEAASLVSLQIRQKFSSGMLKNIFERQKDLVKLLKF